MEKVGAEKETEMRKGKVGEELEGGKQNWKENWKETGNEQKEKGEEELEMESDRYGMEEEDLDIQTR